MHSACEMYFWVMLDFEAKVIKENHRPAEVGLKNKCRPLVPGEVLPENRSLLDCF